MRPNGPDLQLPPARTATEYRPAAAGVSTVNLHVHLTAAGLGGGRCRGRRAVSCKAVLACTAGSLRPERPPLGAPGGSADCVRNSAEPRRVWATAGCARKGAEAPPPRGL